ncbi:MAG: hypothetical protein CVV47_06030 [Spirochaetae bacterium HGW-Spirochaetae-3]|jgi:hypothetical protein|nr:MAG: hypothetical protein CVV47_06030 [Spirochaetae bacterium HGW-Spirochaetae-3]
MTIESKKLTTLLALCTIAASALAFSCKSPLFGLGGQVDTAIPGISVSELEEGGTPRALINGDYVRGSIILRGSVSDDLGIASVSLTFLDSGSTITIDAALDAKAQSWEATIETADFIDGSKDFVVTVTDTVGKTSTTRFVLYFDNKPPTVLLTVPAADEGLASDSLYGTVAIKGSAADQFGIRKVRVFLYNEAGALLYASPDDASIGTNSFALQLDTSSLIGKTGSERGYVYVRAWDRSGNTNTQFYRLDEIKALNANLGATVEELHALETGTSSTINDLTLAALVGTRRYEPGTGYDDDHLISYYFDQNSNLPIITISNPEEGKTASQNLLSTNAKAMGLVQDANGVDLVEIQFRLVDSTETDWYYDAHPADDSAGDDIEASGTGRVVNWYTKPLFENYGGLIADVQNIRVRATDSDGNVRTSEWVPFTIDANVPDVTITSPLPGDYLNGDPITIEGTARSYGTATIGRVDLSVDGQFDYAEASITSGAGTQNVEWSFSISSALVPTDGTYTIKARVTDSPGNKQALYNIVATIDRTAPHSLAFISPSNGASVNGYPTIMGQAKDNVLLKEVYLVFEKSGEEQKLADAYNWTYNLDAGMSANTTDGYDMGNNIFRVPFRIKAVDQANNIALSPAFGTDPDDPGVGSYYLDVDLDGDKPEITNIVSPGAENVIGTPYVITGSIKVQGTATDDDRLHSIEMALIAISGATESWRSLDGATAVAEGTFYPVNGLTLWSYVLNDLGNLYALSDLAGHAGDFRIIVRAVDTKDLVSTTPVADVTGDEHTVYVRFDNTLPGVIDLSPEEGTMQSGTFPLTFTAQDNFSVVLAQISYNNGSSYATLPITAGSSVPLSVSVNTKTVNAGALASVSGTLYMRIRLKDDGDNITEKSFKYLIDNIAPVDVTAPSAVTMSAISNRMYTEAGASLAEILGVVNDTGTVRGIDRVEVYFERGGAIYRLNPDKAASSVAGKSYTFSNGVTALYPYDTEPDDLDDYKVIVDKAENYVDGDADGYQESLTQGSTGYTWGARYDSTKIYDGDVTVHYVAWDDAGNSSHFQAAGIITNNPPVLAAMTLGTSLNGDTDATDDGERVRLTRQADGTWRGYTLKADGSQLGAERVYDLADPVLTIRNNLFTFSAAVSGGNAPLSYNALAPDGSTPLLGWDAASAYAVTAFGTAGWVEDSVNTLTIHARDTAYGTPLATAALSFKVRVDNTDGTAPEIGLAPVGSRYAAPEDGLSLSYSARAEEAVEGYSDNLLWIDEDLNGDCSWDERLGHVELPADSLHDGLDADVSGVVKMRGKVYDDQRVSKLTVSFSVGFDTNGSAAGGAVAAGNEIDLALFSSGNLSVVAERQAAMDAASNALSFALDGKNTPELSDELGHAMGYELTWNTAFITGVASDNVIVTVKAYNADGTLSSSATQTVDVVPYITSIARSGDYNTIRSRHGRYAASLGETITIYGFNIRNSASDTISFGTSAPVAISSGGISSFGIAIPASAKSGQVTVTVSGIDSINNVNADADYSSEASAAASLDGSTLWGDDRSMHLWRSDDAQAGSDRGYFTGSADPEYPAMSMDPATGVLYASWNNYALSRIYWGTSAGAYSTIFTGYDPSEHTDIHYGSRPTVVWNANLYGNNTWNSTGAGGVYVWDQYANSALTGTGNAYESELLYHDQKLMQFINQRVVTSGSDIHISYYDTDTKALKYWHHTSNTNPAYAMDWINVDGGMDEHDGNSTTTITYASATATNVTHQAPSNGVTVASHNVVLGQKVASGTILVTLSNATQITATQNGYVSYLLDIGDAVSRWSATTVATLASHSVYSSSTNVGEAVVTAPTATVLLTLTDYAGTNTNITASVAGLISYRSPVGTPVTGTTTLASIMTDYSRIVSANRSASAGEFSAIDTNPSGYPVIAYYDMSNQTVKIARASAVNPSGAQWALQTAMVVTPWKDTNFKYSGKYITMRIDEAGYLHMAFYRNSTGDLLYMKSTNKPSDGTTAYAFGPSVIVDDLGSVGVWADLAIYEPTPGSTAEDDARPYVSYLDSSLANTFDGIKVAYWDPGLERSSDGLPSGGIDSDSQPDSPDGWETINAPMLYEVENVRTGVEYYNDAGAPPDSDYSIRIGYSSTDYYRVGYYVKE